MLCDLDSLWEFVEARGDRDCESQTSNKGWMFGVGMRCR
jgi:hypothetical protein